ncbi:MAG: hypothetical protein KGZ90_10850 [Algoriphagus sp.]|nr:hypothetical protein [Algoriphagus sp.]
MIRKIFEDWNRGILPIAISFLVGCSSGKTEESIYFKESDLPIEVLLKAEKLKLNGLQNPRQIHVNEQFIVVSQPNQDLMLNVYDKKGHLLINQLGKNGVGPGEISYVRTIESLDDPYDIWVYDSQYKSYHVYDLRDTTTAISKKSFNRNESFFYIGEMALLSDSSVWAIMMDKETQYFILGFENDTLASFGNWLTYDSRKDIPASTISSMHQGRMGVNRKGRYGVRAGLFRDYIDIVDLSEGKVTTLFGPSNHMTPYTVEYSQGYPMPKIDEKEARAHYYNVFAGEKSMFLLYYGGAINELGNSDRKMRIFEIDYSGKILSNFVLDQNIQSFSIDESEKKIYGVSMDSEPNIITFNY